MTSTKLRAPAALLLHPDLTPSAKLLWCLGRLYPESRSTTELGALSGLSEPTVRHGLTRLATATWSAGRYVTLPAALLTTRQLSPQARLIYGLLQLIPGYSDQSGRTTYAELHDLIRLDPKTLKHALRSLALSGWAEVVQRTQRTPISFTLTHPEQGRIVALKAQMIHRLTVAAHTGESIMKEYLSLLIDSDQFEENANPAFLVNPYTQERMEFDRYYPQGVAFEYNGAQHDGPTDRFPDVEEAARQRGRDLMKLGICQELGIRLVVIRAVDLSLERMRAKVGDALPLRDLQGFGPLVEELERWGRRYQRRIPLQPVRRSGGA